MIKTTRLKAVQVPKNKTYDLTPQINGVTQTFHLPEKVWPHDNHFLLFNGQVYRNDANHTFYKVHDDGTTLTTYFDIAPSVGHNRALQFVKTDNSEGTSELATVEYVNEKVGELNTRIDDEQVARETADQALNDRADAEESARLDADINLQTQIDAIVAASDVKDVVGTKAELDAYDKSALGDNDIIKVLADETQDDATTYYRFVKADNDFTLIGAQGPFYTKAEADAIFLTKAGVDSVYTKGEIDTMMSDKQDTLIAGTGITIAADGRTISAEGEAFETINDTDWSALWQ